MTYGGGGSDPFGGAPFGHNPFGAPPAPVIGPPPPPQQETNTPATLSIVFAFVFAPAGAVLGHLGLARAQRSAGHGRQRALVGLTLSYAMIVIAVAALVVWLTMPDAERDTPRLADPQLSGYLVSLEEMKNLITAGGQGLPGVPAPTMTAEPGTSAPASEPYGDGTIAPADAAPCLVAGAAPAYESVKYRSFYRIPMIQNRPDDPQRVVQSVALFNDADEAQRAFQGYIERLNACDDDNPIKWTDTRSGEVTEWIIVPNAGAQSEARGDFSITGFQRRGTDRDVSVVRTIAAKGTLLIDVSAEGKNAITPSWETMERILDRIPS